MKIETFLPAFSGTYGTYWTFDDEQFLLESDENFNETYQVDHKKYLDSICKFICNYLEQELKDYITGIEFQEAGSPREYNFTNDWCNVEITLSKSNVDKIKEFIYENKEAFEQYLKDEFSSYPGFVSFRSNNFDEWLTDTKDFTDFSKDNHTLGWILQFICDQLEIEDETMVSKWRENDSYSNYIIDEEN